MLRVVLVNLDGHAKETRMYFVLMLWLWSTYNMERGVQLSLKKCLRLVWEVLLFICCFYWLMNEETGLAYSIVGGKQS